MDRVFVASRPVSAAEDNVDEGTHVAGDVLRALFLL
jgi:hypothetical protein